MPTSALLNPAFVPPSPNAALKGPPALGSARPVDSLKSDLDADRVTMADVPLPLNKFALYETRRCVPEPP